MHSTRSARQQGLRLTQVAALVASSAFATMFTGVVQAQTATPSATATEEGPKDGVNLNRVVVTATSAPKSKMRSSVSVTDVDQDTVKDFGARTEAEVLMLIPGIRTEATAGPGGNANITVRGLLISSGGSKYVQLQEDGLPIVQFGDMMFANNDYWTRFDTTVDSIQTLRGGSSSVFASHAPGAVINYISKNGKQSGGGISLTRGVNYGETRLDGDYGGKLSNDTYFHIGGYFREGEGTRRATSGALSGYQIKANLTKEFNGGKGYVRVYLKALDEHAPTSPQTYLTATQGGGTISGFGQAPGFDSLRDSQYSRYITSFSAMDPVSGVISQSSLTKGISSNSKSVGFEFHNELNGGFTVDNKFRLTKSAGAFQSMFWGGWTSVADWYANNPGGTMRFYNGPLAGQVVTTANAVTPITTGSGAINVQTPDMGTMFNDLSVSKAFALNASTKLNAKAGLFMSRQNVVQTWSISRFSSEAKYNGAIVDLYDANGAALTKAGLAGYNDSWGADSAKNINERFTTTSPYLSLNVETGNWDFDAGIRRETFKSSGYADIGVKTPTDLNGDDQLDALEKTVTLARNRIIGDYSLSYTNYSLGANYRFNKDLSAFVRTSKGGRATADRFYTTQNNFNADGSLPAGARDAALAIVKQHEVGVKNRGNLAGGQYAVAATLFYSTTAEGDYDPTRINQVNGGAVINYFGYKAKGVELESSYGIGAFSVAANIVYSDEKYTRSDANPTWIGHASGGTSKIRYMIAPRYALGNASFGLAFRGQGKTAGDNEGKTSIAGHVMTSAFVNYDFSSNLRGSVNVNNLFDKLYPSTSAGQIYGNIFGAGVETGRTISATLKYAF